MPCSPRPPSPLVGAERAAVHKALSYLAVPPIFERAGLPQSARRMAWALLRFAACESMAFPSLCVWSFTMKTSCHEDVMPSLRQSSVTPRHVMCFASCAFGASRRALKFWGMCAIWSSLRQSILSHATPRHVCHVMCFAHVAYPIARLWGKRPKLFWPILFGLRTLYFLLGASGVGTYCFGARSPIHISTFV